MVSRRAQAGNMRELEHFVQSLATAACALGAGLTQVATSERVWYLLRFVAVLCITSAFFRMLRRGVRRVVARRLSAQKQHFVFKTLNYLSFTVMTFTAFHWLGINVSALLGAAGIAGVALGFAAQTSVSNVISGLFVMTERAFRIQDVIEIDGIVGAVQSINLLSVALKTLDGQYVRVPNETILKANLVNYSHCPHRRVKTEVSVAYGSDLRRVQQLLLDVATRNRFVLSDPAPAVLWNAFADSGIDVTLLTWTHIEHFNDLRNAIFVDIDECFKQAGIEVPFPHVDVRVQGACDAPRAETV